MGQRSKRVRPRADEDALLRLLQAAAAASLDAARGTPVERKDVPGYVVQAATAVRGVHDIPWYKTSPGYQRMLEARSSTEGVALLDYCEEYGALRRTTVCVPTDADRRQRDSAIWFGAVVSSVLAALNDEGRRAAVAGVQAADWKIAPARLLEDLTALSRLSCRGEFTFRGICPLAGPTLDASVQLDDEVALLKWTPADLAEYCTTRSRWLPEMDPVLVFTTCALKVDLHVAGPSPLPEVNTRVFRAIDTLKLAAWRTRASPSLWSEGPIGIGAIVGDALDHPPIRRIGTTVMTACGEHWSAEQCEELRDAFVTLSTGARRLEPFDGAIWSFGRAYNAVGARDRLVDAVIGAESLLVAGSGENTYRFRLHGAAVAAATRWQQHAGGDVGAQLKRIYSARSTIAHGSSGDADTHLSSSALALLAEIIWAILDLERSGELDVAGCGNNVPVAVEKLVLRRATTRNGSDIP